jgi:hypothetical protein
LISGLRAVPSTSVMISLKFIEVKILSPQIAS